MKTIFLENSFTDIHLLSNTSHQIIDVFSSCSWNKKIHLESDCDVVYVPFFQDFTWDIEVHLLGKASHLSFFGIFLSLDKAPISSRISVHLSSSFASADVHLFCIALDKADISLDGKITIDAHVSWVEWYLHEHHIVLGKDIHITTLPILDVRSQDVKASHGAKIDMLDEEKLFYMMSKWLSHLSSQRLLVEWLIRMVFSHCSAFDDKQKELLLHNILTTCFTS